MTEGSAPIAAVHTMKVTLQDVRPAVWRRLVVPSSITLGELHPVLQAAFGWDDDHLHAFEVRGVRYEPVRPDRFTLPFREPPRDEDRTPLHRVAARPGDVVHYTYDFGDDWQHRLEVEQVGPALPDQQYPACTDGSGLAPEEDIGTPRPGRFDDRARAELNRQLRRWPGADEGRDLPVTDQPPDPAFTGLLPGLVADDGDCPCGCGELADDEAPPLPMTRPVSTDHLARQAAAAPLVRRAVALARWLGEGRTLTPSRLLRPADAVRAVAELDHLGPDDRILPPVLEPDAEDAATRHPWSRPKPATERRATSPASGPRPAQATLFDDHVPDADVQETPPGAALDPGARRIRSAKDLPQLHQLWSACLAAGFVEIRGGRACPGAGLSVWNDLTETTAGPDVAGQDTERANARDQVESWCLLMAGALQARDDAARTGRDHTARLRHQLLQLTIPLIYTAAQEPFPVGAFPLVLTKLDGGSDVFGRSLLYLLPLWSVELRRTIEDWLVAGVLALAPLDPAHNAQLTELVAELRAELATHAQAPAAGRPMDADDAASELVSTMLDGPAVQLTALGRYGLARILTAHGWPVPAAGDRWDDEPEDLLDHLDGYLPNDAADELIGWIDARGERGEAALLRVVRSAGTKDEEGPARRETLQRVLAAAGPRIAALDTVLDAVGTDPWLDATLALVRHELGAGPEPSTAQLLWLVVDGLSTLLDAPDAFAEDVADSPLAELLAEPGMLTTALTLHHPATREVLRAAAPHLEDPDLTRELRRALTGRSGNPALRRGSGRQARNERQRGDNRGRRHRR